MQHPVLVVIAVLTFCAALFSFVHGILKTRNQAHKNFLTMLNDGVFPTDVVEIMSNCSTKVTENEIAQIVNCFKDWRKRKEELFTGFGRTFKKQFLDGHHQRDYRYCLVYDQSPPSKRSYGILYENAVTNPFTPKASVDVPPSHVPDDLVKEVVSALVLFSYPKGTKREFFVHIKKIYQIDQDIGTRCVVLFDMYVHD